MSLPTNSRTELTKKVLVFQQSDFCDNFDFKNSSGCRYWCTRKMNVVGYTKKYCSLKNTLIREFLSEIFSTFFLITFGCGSVAQHVLGPNNKFNSFLSINFAWGSAVTLSILVGGKVSGAHMNPAVSLSMLLMGKLSFCKFIVYIIGQCIGALLGSVMVYVVYLDALLEFDGGKRQVFGDKATAGIWGTYPAPYLSISGAFIDQFFATSLLITLVLAIGDISNDDVSSGIKAILSGNVVFIIGLSFGSNCGYAINPVRDFIPRLFTSFSGWGIDVFRASNYYFWIPICAPLLGAVFATFLYAFMIGNHWPNDKSESKQLNN